MVMIRIIFACLVGAGGLAVAAPNLDLPGPDGTVVFRLSLDPENHLVYSVSANGRTRLEPARAGVLIDGKDFGAGATPGTPKTRRFFEVFPWRGNKTAGTNLCEASEIPMRSATGLEWVLETRVFNDGAAFRFRIPGIGTRRIGGESTSWQLPKDATVWFQTDTANYEGDYHSSRADAVPLEAEVRQKKRPTHIGLPMTIAYADGQFGLITEAALYQYSGLTLRPEGGAKFRAAFEDDPSGWPHEGALVSPWRVIILAKHLDGIVNSDVIPALCDPPDPKLFPDGMNTPWIKPGKAPCTWMVYGNNGAQWDRQKWFVDISAATGCEYLLVDAGWRTEKWGWMKDGGNVWERAAELCRYATERNVGIVLWHAYPEGRDDGPGLTTVEAREDLFRNCQKAGVKGIKIDFFDSESKTVIEAYEDLLRRSAKYQLMINFHGANKPTGEPRTWPHEITREGIREQEYVLWGTLPLAHYGALPFTRLAAGHADFLPGYIQPKFLKNTTVIFQMASVVVFSSPFLCWPDNPEAYLHSPLLQFVRTVPVTWDETRILPGSVIGDTVIMARRKGAAWYVAVLNCRSDARTLSVDLSGLATEGKELTIYRDAPEGTGCQVETGLQVPADRKLSVALRPGGGFMALLQAPQTFTGWK
jgi:hypothetical protein